MNQEQYISGGHDNGRDFFQYQGELSKRFYFTPGDYWGEHNAMQEAADSRDEVIAARSAIAGRPLTPREAAFGITRRDDRDFETKRVAQLELQQFTLTVPVTLSDGERELLAAEKQMQQEQHLRDDLSLTPGERAAKFARDKIEREQIEAERQAELAAHLNDPITKQLLRAVSDIQQLANWNDSYTAEDLENLAKVKKAVSNPEWKQAGRDYAKSYFEAERVKRNEVTAAKNKALDEQEQQLAAARKAAKESVPDSVRVAASILNSQAVESEQ